jgi:hypothetical protein
VTGKVFSVQGGQISELVPWQVGESVGAEGDWTIELVQDRLGAAIA